jgi:hypothetical protein
MQLEGRDPIAVGTNGSVETSGLTVGSYEVVIGDIASNCQQSSENPLAVAIQSEETTEITFEVGCVARTGVLQFRTFTSGSSPDMDGFVVLVDGSERRPIPPTGAAALSVAPGDDVEFVTFVVRC